MDAIFDGYSSHFIISPLIPYASFIGNKLPEHFIFGNPVSTVIGFRFFILPFLRHLIDLPPERALTAILINEYQKNNRLKQFLKTQAAVNDQGQFSAEILDGQESFKIQPLLKTNGWIMADESDNVLSAGMKKGFYPWLSVFK